ncbi:MAG TPA: TerC family protein [Gemmataceae bacterium]|nr:TerC family protein [Gemmataceae bacterium]
MALRTLLLIGFTVLAACAIAADEPAPEVEVQTTDGSTVTGKLLNPVIRLKTNHMTGDVDPRTIKRVTFSPGDAAGGHDTIEFTDGNYVRCQVVNEAIQVETAAGVESLKTSELREIKTRHPVQLGLWAILLGLVTLSAMEIVLGIDNIIFLAIVAGKLPEPQQPRARRIGLLAALGTRILLLLSLSFLLGLTKPVFTIPDMPYFHDLEAREVSLRDLILLAGGLFLIGKSVREMHEKLEATRFHDESPKPGRAATFGGVLIQIAVLDIVFSLDSVITAVGMVDQVWVMIVAMVIAMLVMMMFAGAISDFVAKHPTIKVLALAFLILIGVMLVAESLGQHINKGYIYFAMAFAVLIEMINMRLRRPKPVSMERATV